MVRQGDIVKLSFNPQMGHEQAGFRPAVVVSNDVFNRNSNFAILCPITNTNNKFPLHVPLDSRTETTGFILCEHIKSLDINAREHVFIEKCPDDILEKVVNIVFSQVEII